MKLISMTDYVLEQEERLKNLQNKVIRDVICSHVLCVDYANFLKRPLELGMFIPCDEDGNVLNEKLCENHEKCCTLKEYCKENYQYQKAKEMVLFEGFKYLGGRAVEIEGRPPITIMGTIEDLIPYNLTLTKETIKNLKI